uniref:Uncharacterized protein n=1 Tax=mine drainage metagenome TaxID=410659 RepID=E6QVN5_9ZZZZ
MGLPELGQYQVVVLD